MSMKPSSVFRPGLLSLLIGAVLAVGGLIIFEDTRGEALSPAAEREQRSVRLSPESGAITGTIGYTGTVTGTHLVWAGAFTSTQGGPPVYATVRDGPGPYTLAGIGEGIYYIMAGMDADDSGGPPDPAIDPLGVYAHNPVTVTGGVVITAVDVLLLDPTPPPTETGSIAGLTSYVGGITTTHNVIVVAGRVEDPGPPQYWTVIFGTGPYTITNMADGTYNVAAFMDLDGDMGPPQPDEPFGWYDPAGDGSPDPVLVSEGNAVTGIDISLHDPSRYLYLPLVLRASGR